MPKQECVNFINKMAQNGAKKNIRMTDASCRLIKKLQQPETKSQLYLLVLPFLFIINIIDIA